MIQAKKRPNVFAALTNLFIFSVIFINFVSTTEIHEPFLKELDYKLDNNRLIFLCGFTTIIIFARSAALLDIFYNDPSLFFILFLIPFQRGLSRNVLKPASAFNFLM